MFLLNSRAPLVTAPCYHLATTAGTPYSEVTGLICRVPSIELHLHTLGYSPRGTSAGSGYRCPGFFLVPFSWTQGISRISHKDTIHKFNLGLIITILTRFILFNINDSLCRLIPKCQKQNLRCRTYPNSTGILTCFPFPSVKL